MKTRRIFIIITTLILIVGVALGLMQTLTAQPALRTTAELENVRAYVAATQSDGVNYAVDGGSLFAGHPGAWTEVRTPNQVVVSTVAVDTVNPERVYIGAANELALYRSTNRGANWQRVPLVEEDGVMTGGVTTLAVDPVQQLVYVGTDTGGLFRLRDVGSSMTLTAHLLTPEPVREIAVDARGNGFLFARTDWTLYRAEDHGLTWRTVDNIGSAPTALAIGAVDDAARTPVVYVGTVDRGVVSSLDGHNWATANEGLNFVAGSRLYVDALTTDPAQPGTLYAATSYLYGSTTTHATPSTVFMGEALAATASWTQVGETLPATAAALLPVSGQPGAVYALTTASRTPLALGNAVDMTALAAANTADQTTPVTAPEPAVNWTAILAWIVAGLAAAALVFAIVTDLRRRPTPVVEPKGLVRQTVDNK